MTAEPSSRVEVRGSVPAQPLPCPFCGSSEIVKGHLVVGGKLMVCMLCRSCGARGPVVPTEGLARERRDTRHFQVTPAWDPADAEKWTPSGPDSSRS